MTPKHAFDPTLPDPTLLERLDPTRAERWGQMRGRAARLAFVISYGVVACGVPAAVLVDLYALTRRGEWDLFFSLRHAVQLQLAVLLVAPSVGALLGAALLRVGDRRQAQAELKRAFALAPPDAAADRGPTAA